MIDPPSPGCCWKGVGAGDPPGLRSLGYVHKAMRFHIPPSMVYIHVLTGGGKGVHGRMNST